MLYECPRCKYVSDNKCHYIKHLQKKKECPAIFSSKLSSEILQELIDSKNAPKIHKCDQCDKSFSYSKSLAKHIKDTHITTNINITNTNTTNSNNDSSNHHNTNNSHNTTNNTHYNINQVINIELRPFGDELMDYLLNNKELMTKFLKSALSTGLPKMFEEIHMNSEHPENHNIKHKSSKYPAKVNVYMKLEGKDKAEWVARHTNEMVEIAMVGMINHLRNHKNDLFKEIEKPTKEDEELFFYREDVLYDIKNKNKRKFAPIRNNIVLLLKENK
jgi:uncharacterized C2H2 Zn-finger protein